MTQAKVQLKFDKAPSALTGFLRAAVARPRGLKSGEPFPKIEASVSGMRADPAKLRKYRALCGFTDTGKLPPTYPHVLAAPVHLAVLTHKSFPYKLLGAVHLRNEIVQHRAIGESEAIDLRVVVAAQHPVDLGVEIELLTQFKDAKGGLVWEGVSFFLIRLKRAAGGKKKDGGWTPPDFSAYQPLAEWPAPENIGRKYGPVAGDVNPIHLHALTAKPMGFRRAIAHGMWTFAHSVADTTRSYSDGPLTLHVAFKRPLFLPGKAFLLSRSAGEKTEYLLTNAKRDTLYLTGTVAMAKPYGKK